MERNDITLTTQLGVGQFGPIYDAEVQLGLDVTSRAVVKVCVVPVKPFYPVRKPHTLWKSTRVINNSVCVQCE